MNKKSIECMVNYLHEPLWKPYPIRNYTFSNDMESFRRCFPLGVGLDFCRDDLKGDKLQFFTDGTLEVVNDRPIATLILTASGMPIYQSLQRVRHIPATHIPQSGKWYKVSLSHNAKEFGITKEDQLFVIDTYFAAREGKYYKIIRREGGDDNLGHEQIPEILSGAALVARYVASAEFNCGNGTSCAVPLSLGQLKTIFNDRDKPEKGDRRPALIHLVQAHERVLPDGYHSRVREFLRGKIECKWRGWEVTLRPSPFDMERLSTPRASIMAKAEP